MKRKETFILRRITDDYVMMPVGETAKKFSGLIMANAVSAFMWENIENVNSAEEMAKLVFEEFEVDYDIALDDVKKIINDMLKAGWIE